MYYDKKPACTYHNVILNIVIGWPISYQELHSFEFDESWRRSDILLSHDAGHLLFRVFYLLEKYGLVAGTYVVYIIASQKKKKKMEAISFFLH